MLTPLGRELASILSDDPVDLARAALVIARLEYPSLDPVPTLAKLSALGDRAAERLQQLDAAPVRTRIAALNRLIYREEHFAGNRAHYDDFRNSLLNVVLERRLGIPISLAVVYMEVARRAGLDVRGVAFPGHFLMRVVNPAGEAGVILDPFDGGDEMDEQGCRQLLARRLGDDFRNSLLNVVLERRLGIPISLAVVYMEVARRAGLDVRGVAFPGHFLMCVANPAGEAGVILDPFDGGDEMDEQGCRQLLARRLGDDAGYDEELLSPCSSRQIISRILNNLKRTYIELRSFEHARQVSDLMLAVDPGALTEVRDRGLIAYHLDDYSGALRDLEDYFRLQTWSEDSREERDQIWAHVKNLRRRLAGLN